jgi:hypothetical protein
LCGAGQRAFEQGQSLICSKGAPSSGEISDGFGFLTCKDGYAARTNLLTNEFFNGVLAAVMDDAVCADCTRLYQAALDALIRHNYVRSRLAIAKLERDTPKIRVLEPVVEHLGQARKAAIRAYQEHVATHAQKAAQRGV